MNTKNEFNTWTKITWTKSDTWRNGYKWSVNECLRLEREFDLLQLSVPEIAKLHNRTVNAIMFKLDAEGIDTFNNLYIKTYGTDFLHEEINNCISNTGCYDNVSNNNDTSSDDDYVPNLDDDDEKEKDKDNANEDPKLASNSYLLHQIKNMQTQLNTILNYFTNKPDTRHESTHESSYH
jgi:hypothetical protein